MSQIVVHRDGSEERFQFEMIIKALENLFDQLDSEDKFVHMRRIIKNFEIKLPARVTTEEIDTLLLKAIEPLITDDRIYDIVATRLQAKLIHKSVGSLFCSFRDYIHYAVSHGLLHKDLLKFDLDSLEFSMDHTRDDNFDFFGISSFHKKYQLHDYMIKGKKVILEKPQRTWMRMAMGVSLPEKDYNDFARLVYDQISTFRYMHSHSYNSGYPRSQMSSCFISVVDDSLDSIMQKATELAQLSKYEGGVAISTTKLRAAGSLIKGINQNSSGPIPFIKIYDTIKHAMLQGTGKRRSALVVYMEPWHLDIREFLDLKETNGDEYTRARTINTALWIPDEFMKRVENDLLWYLFDPAETPELAESWGEEFSQWYDHYISVGQEGKLHSFISLPARELYQEMMRKLAKTGNYWMCYKDTHNRFNQASSYGMIHSSNLCTEISIPNTPNSTAVCTISSINLSKFTDPIATRALGSHSSREDIKRCIAWDKLSETIRIAVRALDNIVEFNFYPYPDAEKNSLDLRPLGLGVMGFADMLLDLHIAYDDPRACELAEKLSKFIYDACLEQSVLLAQEKGAFRNYDSSKYAYGPRRNILLTAIAPTASISLLCGCSSGIDSYFSMIYSRETSTVGKMVIVVKQLVKRLQEKGIWNEEIKQKIVAAGGSVQSIPELRGFIDISLFKTAYEFSPESQIAIAAAWQKHVDQSISRNMYFREHLRDSLGDYYMLAWKKGLKSTYYCFIEKTIQGEKYTQDSSKRGGRTGFGKKLDSSLTTSSVSSRDALRNKIASGISLTDEEKILIEKKVREEKGDEYISSLKKGSLGTCPVDPFEAVMCESCQ